MEDDQKTSSGAVQQGGTESIQGPFLASHDHPHAEQEDIFLAGLVDSVAQDVVSGPLLELTGINHPKSGPPTEEEPPPPAAQPTSPLLAAMNAPPVKKWPPVQAPQRLRRYSQGSVPSSVFKADAPLIDRMAADQVQRPAEADQAVHTRVSNDGTSAAGPIQADNKPASLLGLPQLAGLAPASKDIPIARSISVVNANTRPALQPPQNAQSPTISQSPLGLHPPLVSQPSASMPPTPASGPIPSPQPAAGQQIGPAMLGAYALQSMLFGQGAMQQNGGYRPMQQATSHQGFQMMQPQVYSAWPPQNYLVAPSAINVPQPVMQLMMPQMQTTDQQHFGAGPIYQDFRSLLNPASGQLTPIPAPQLSPDLEPVNAPPPPPFLSKEDIKNQSFHQVAPTSDPVSRQAEKSSEYPSLLQRGLSRFGDNHNYAEILQGSASTSSAYEAPVGPSEEQPPKAVQSRERSATIDSLPSHGNGTESPRARAASMDTIRASRSLVSRPGTSFSVPVREAFTVVNEDEEYNGREESGAYNEGGNGDVIEASGVFEESISPRKEPFLGQDGFKESPEKDEGADEGRGRVASNVMSALKPGSKALSRSGSAVQRTPNEEQLLQAIMRSREAKSFMEKGYDDLETAHGDPDDDSEDDEEEGDQAALPAISTKRTMSPSYGAAAAGRRLTRAERKKKAIQDTLSKVLQRIEVYEEEREAQRSEQQGRSWWSRLRERRTLKKRTKQRFEGTDLWDGQLKLLEGRFGSSISLTFAFLRFVFYVNMATTVCWFFLIILPFLVSPPPSFNWSIFTSSSITSLLQGNGLDKTWFYYGGYNYKYWTEKETGDQKGWYQTDYMYPIAILTMFLIGLFAIMRKIAQRLAGEGDSSIVQGNMYFPFSTLVFGSWDFHITNVEAAKKLRRGIRMQLREMLNDDRAAQNEEVINKGSTRVLLVLQRAFVLGILWPLLVAGTAAVVVIAITQGEYLNTHLGSDFGQSIILALINTVGPSLVRFLVTLEFWRPATAERVETTKIYVIRMINAGTLFYRLYYIFRSAAKVHHTTTYGSVDGQVTSVLVPKCGPENLYKCEEGYECCTAGADYCESDPTTVGSQVGQCVTACVENVIGRLLLRFLVVNSLISNASELGYSLVMLLFTQKKRQILVPDMAIDIIYVQSLVWIGAIYCPMAPFFGACLNAFQFWWMKNVALATCAPPEKTYSASRTSNLTYGLLLVTLLLCSVPATISFLQSHQECGPHMFSSMQTRVNYYIGRAPTALHLAFQYLGNPAILGGVIALLVFALILVRAKETKYQTSMAMTQKELSNYRKETHQKISNIRLQSMGLSPTPLSVSGRHSPAHPLISKSVMLAQSRDRSPSRQSPRSPQSPNSPQSPPPDSAKSVMSTSSYGSQTALLSTTRLRR